MVEKNSPRYIDVLPKIVESYNRTWHSGIRSEPFNVNKTNENQLWWQMYWPKEPYDPNRKKHEIKYVLLRLCVQNRRKKWNFPPNFRNGII